MNSLVFQLDFVKILVTIILKDFLNIHVLVVLIQLFIYLFVLIPSSLLKFICIENTRIFSLLSHHKLLKRVCTIKLKKGKYSIINLLSYVDKVHCTFVFSIMS